ALLHRQRLRAARGWCSRLAAQGGDAMSASPTTRLYFACLVCTAKWFAGVLVVVCPRCGGRVGSGEPLLPPWEIVDGTRELLDAELPRVQNEGLLPVNLCHIQYVFCRIALGPLLALQGRTLPEFFSTAFPFPRLGT